MLMDPLVSALNGSQSLVSQGLRTLELCVDNLQPDFLYDHIQPVKSDLMQALWKTLRNPMETMAHVAFRVLGIYFVLFFLIKCVSDWFISVYMQFYLIITK